MCGLFPVLAEIYKPEDGNYFRYITSVPIIPWLETLSYAQLTDLLKSGKLPDLKFRRTSERDFTGPLIAEYIKTVVPSSDISPELAPYCKVRIEISIIKNMIADKVVNNAVDSLLGQAEF